MGRGPLSLGLFENAGANSFDWVHLAGLEERGSIMDAQRFVKLRSIQEVFLLSEKQRCVYCGNFITYSWFNISSKCTDLSGLVTWKGWGGALS